MRDEMRVLCIFYIYLVRITRTCDITVIHPKLGRQVTTNHLTDYLHSHAASPFFLYSPNSELHHMPQLPLQAQAVNVFSCSSLHSACYLSEIPPSSKMAQFCKQKQPHLHRIQYPYYNSSHSAHHNYQTPSSPQRENNRSEKNPITASARSPTSLCLSLNSNISSWLFKTLALNNKTVILNKFICLTKTWHSHLDYFSLNQATPTGGQPRLTSQGSGVASIHRKAFKMNTSVHSFENNPLKLPGPTSLVIAVIYRIPKPLSR